MNIRERVGQMDIVGAALLMCSITCLLLALEWGGSTYMWSNVRVWGVLIAAISFAITFIVLQICLKEKATLPPRIM